VRQAIDAYLRSTPSAADSTALLMLGAHLGPSTRLNTLNAPDVRDRLATWFVQLWGDKRPEQREEARRTVLGAVDYWRDQQWMQEDLGAGLR